MFGYKSSFLIHNSQEVSNVSDDVGDDDGNDKMIRMIIMLITIVV